MTTFLLLLSLILNAAAIFAIILLYLRQNRLVEAEKKQERIIKEIEEVFSAYLYELKEENDQFLQLISNSSIEKKQVKNLEIQDEQIDDVNLELSHETNQGPHAPRYGKGVAYYAARKAYQQNSTPVPNKEEAGEKLEENQADEPKTESEPIRFIDQVFQMKESGMTVEEIARNLDRGKTEIELLLKFRQNARE
ncbi:hypothetical protein [Mesobacillus subterraneus]|uniref:Swarming motility protein SwrB n=1 Tax=Mesobacillus subterraneus TaxID=285983 RepID=A0A427TU85_9BACI|nr:hypothetical protein [Mesobacillus subterraneus]RSD27998.1 hypothetical protein EJA10_05910 [Mesobacillus subterraneus]